MDETRRREPMAFQRPVGFGAPDHFPTEIPQSVKTTFTYADHLSHLVVLSTYEGMEQFTEKLQTVLAKITPNLKDGHAHLYMFDLGGVGIIFDVMSHDEYVYDIEIRLGPLDDHTEERFTALRTVLTQMNYVGVFAGSDYTEAIARYRRR